MVIAQLSDKKRIKLLCFNPSGAIPTASGSLTERSDTMSEQVEQHIASCVISQSKILLNSTVNSLFNVAFGEYYFATLNTEIR